MFIRCEKIREKARVHKKNCFAHDFNVWLVGEYRKSQIFYSSVFLVNATVFLNLENISFSKKNIRIIRKNQNELIKIIILRSNDANVNKIFIRDLKMSTSEK